MLNSVGNSKLDRVIEMVNLMAELEYYEWATIHVSSQRLVNLLQNEIKMIQSDKSVLNKALGNFLIHEESGSYCLTYMGRIEATIDPERIDWACRIVDGG